MTDHHTDQSFSQSLLDIANSIGSGGLTLTELLKKIGSRGLLMLCMILTIPFLLPVSIPGTSAPFGLVIALTGVGILLDRPPWIPKRIMEKRLPSDRLIAVLTKGAGLFSKIEKMVHPRLGILTHKATIGRLNGMALILSAVLLMAPVPLPFTNTLPAYGVLFLALGRLEDDGYAILAGYLMIALTLLYFGAICLLGVTGLKAMA